MPVTSPDTLKKSVIQGPEVNKRPYWFIWECKKDGCKKVSPYAESVSLSSLFLTKTIYVMCIGHLDFHKKVCLSDGTIVKCTN